MYTGDNAEFQGPGGHPGEEMPQVGHELRGWGNSCSLHKDIVKTD